jgi:zinc D-Ala-D-Ala carboxypeptidase
MNYKKNTYTQLSEHFNSSDFDCHCEYPECEDTEIEDKLIDALEDLYELIGPIHIDSGYRCEKHNKDIGGSPKSQHLLGMAADCKSMVKGMTGKLILIAAETVFDFYNGGIGVAKDWCHLDVRNGKARWNYPIT